MLSVEPLGLQMGREREGKGERPVEQTAHRDVHYIVLTEELSPHNLCTSQRTQQVLFISSPAL